MEEIYYSYDVEGASKVYQDYKNKGFNKENINEFAHEYNKVLRGDTYDEKVTTDVVNGLLSKYSEDYNTIAEVIRNSIRKKVEFSNNSNMRTVELAYKDKYIYQITVDDKDQLQGLKYKKINDKEFLNHILLEDEDKGKVLKLGDTESLLEKYSVGLGLFSKLDNIRGVLFNAPNDVKKSFNNIVKYFSDEKYYKFMLPGVAQYAAEKIPGLKDHKVVKLLQNPNDEYWSIKCTKEEMEDYIHKCIESGDRRLVEMFKDCEFPLELNEYPTLNRYNQGVFIR